MLPLRRRLAPSMLGVAGALAILAAFLWQVSAVGDFHIDDAYITFSFSKNLATGHGPVYSHGVVVEGYSNFLWMILVAAPLALRPSLDPYLVARVLTVPFAVLLVWATYGLLRRGGRGASRGLAWVALVLLALDADLAVAGLSALETLPYVALVTAGFALYLGGLSGDARARRLAVPCFAAVSLMRVDGALCFGFVIAVELLRVVASRRFRAGAFVRWAGPGAGVVLVWALWRWRYYGMLLPNTYYAKALIPRALPDRGFQYVRDFWTSTGLFLAAPFALLALAGRARRDAAVLLGFVGVQTAYVVRVGGDWMPFWRFMLPVVPLTVVLLGWGVREAAARAARVHVGAGAAATAAALAAIAWMGRRVDGHAAETPVERDKLATVRGIESGMVNSLVPLSQLLGQAVRPGQRVVSDYAGVMAYFTDAEVIDMWGLANRTIALRGTTEGINPIWGRTCPKCYASLAPDYFHVAGVVAPDAFHDHRGVVGGVFQSSTIGKYVDFRKFAAGRVVDPERKQAAWFLERRQAGFTSAPRRLPGGVVVDYPFEGKR